MRLGLVVVAVLLAGCTASFPDNAPVLAELEVGTLGAGEHATRDVTLPEGAGFLLVGFRTGPATHVHVAFRAPNGTMFDTTAADERAGACVVTTVPAGEWRLDVWPDAFDGELRGGKFTVRAAPGQPPALYACRDARFPAPGRNVTLGVWQFNLTANQTVERSFELPRAAGALQAATRDGANGTMPANATNATPNTTAPTVLLAPPGGSFAPATTLDVRTTGTWRVRVTAPLERALDNWTLAVQAVGS